jgi:multiple sugar transport system ATP-binding protein
MSLYDNLAFGLKSRKFSSTEIRKRVLDAAEILGLKELLEGKAESISGDQRQRVALARALALRPKVVLFDEPLAGLAAAADESLRHEITQLHQRLQATMIYATHNPVEAMALGGRIIIVNRGAVEQDGPAQTLYDEPANVFVAEFFGSPPMNLILGSLKQDRDWLLFSEAEGGTIEARLPISAFPAGQDFMGKTVLLGIRPEDIKMADPAKTERYSGGFPALIDAVELAGSEANLSLQTGAHALRCRVARAEMPSEVGQRGRFQLNLSQLRLFDPNSTRRVAQTS